MKTGESSRDDPLIDDPLIDEEYPGVYWVRAVWLIHNLKDGERMPRCQDLPGKAFGKRSDAVRTFAVTHPWLGRWQPDPEGIQVETLRAKFAKYFKNMVLDNNDVVFFDYMSLPQVQHLTGQDDRTPAEQQRFRSALTGDVMGRIFLTSRVLIIDEVPRHAESNTAYIDRGWCYFEMLVASMNTLARDLEWVLPETKAEIARFRTLCSEFRDTGGSFDELLENFDSELKTKNFSNPRDSQMVRSFFVSLARSQRLVGAAARGDWEGCAQALEQGADPRARDGSCRTALHAAVSNVRVDVVANLLKFGGDDCVLSTVLEMKTTSNETALELAKEVASRECQVLLNHKRAHLIENGCLEEGSAALRSQTFPELIIRSLENDVDRLSELLNGADSVEADERDDEEYTALYYAVSLKYASVVKLLVHAGANPDLPVVAGESARQLAIRSGCEGIFDC